MYMCIYSVCKRSKQSLRRRKGARYFVGVGGYVDTYRYVWLWCNVRLTLFQHAFTLLESRLNNVNGHFRWEWTFQRQKHWELRGYNLAWASKCARASKTNILAPVLLVRTAIAEPISALTNLKRYCWAHEHDFLSCERYVLYNKTYGTGSNDWLSWRPWCRCRAWLQRVLRLVLLRLPSKLQVHDRV